ncbi:hypothetical protein [Bacillus sp. FJAT-28004]|uniref:hypothetical protein n=1 Tax=Bacillus sp. FJAT-28004 TaxID=1679165 RepID=UPI0006B5B52F|nr:hypothetical protein [Bacillus sp. FJAT-28004]
MKKVFLVLVFVLVVATGCSSASKVIPIQFEETIGDLAYEIQLSKNQYEMNDEIEVNAKVTNLGKEMLTYVKGSSSCPNNVWIQIVNQDSNRYLANKPVDQSCTSDLAKSQLAPAQTVEQKLIFVPKYYGKSNLEPAIPGTYDVKVSLPPEDIETTEDYQSKLINERPSSKTSIMVHDAKS